MANQTITIPSPVLTGSEKFKVRYRQLPSGVFSAYQDRTNAPFTLTGLSEGNYEVEIIFVTASGIECEPTYEYFDIYADYTCLDFYSQMIEQPANSGLFYIKVNFQIGTAPPCGWQITLAPLDGSPIRTLTYPTLPSSGELRISSPNKDTRLTATALLCNGREKECYSVIVSKVVIPTPCVPLVIVSTEMVFNPGGAPWSLHIVFTQSTPPTKGINVQWQQVGTPVVPGTPMDSGSFVLPGFVYFSAPGGNHQVYINQLNPTSVYGQFTYNCKMLDECGTWHHFQVSGG